MRRSEGRTVLWFSLAMRLRVAIVSYDKNKLPLKSCSRAYNCTCDSATVRACHCVCVGACAVKTGTDNAVGMSDISVRF